MREISPRIALQEPAATFSVPPGREDLMRTMLEFLEWVESAKGLTLCQAFKPQYDWYMPAFANKAALACEFLGKEAVARGKAKGEDLT